MNQSFILSRRKQLIGASILIGILLIYDSVTTIKNVVNVDDVQKMLFEEDTIDLFNGLDISLLVNTAIQLVFLIVGLVFWKDYNVSKIMIFISSISFLFIPLFLYYIPYTQISECKPTLFWGLSSIASSGLNTTKLDPILENMNSTMTAKELVASGIYSMTEPYQKQMCSYIILYGVLSYLPTITTSAMIIFPAIMNACNLIANEFGNLPEINIIRKVICFGFIPISAIVLGLAWQVLEYVPILFLEISIILYLVSVAMNKNKYMNYIFLCLTGTLFLVISIHYELNMGSILIRGAVRYIYSIVLYKDIIVYVVMYIHKHRSENIYKKLEDSFLADDDIQLESVEIQ